MMGNSLNPLSDVAQKMTSSLNNEIKTHKKFNQNSNTSTSTPKSVLKGPQLHRRNQKAPQNKPVC